MQNFNTPKNVFGADAGECSMSINGRNVLFIDISEELETLAPKIGAREARIELNETPAVVQIDGKAVDVLKVFAVPEFYPEANGGTIGVYKIAAVTSSGEYLFEMGNIHSDPSGVELDTRHAVSFEIRDVLEGFDLTLAPEFESWFANYERITD